MTGAGTWFHHFIPRADQHPVSDQRALVHAPAFGDGDSAFHRARIADCPDDADEAFFLRKVNRVYVEIFRSIPILVMLLWVYYGLPPALGIRLDVLWAGSAGLGVMRQRL